MNFFAYNLRHFLFGAQASKLGVFLFALPRFANSDRWFRGAAYLRDEVSRLRISEENTKFWSSESKQNGFCYAES